MADGEDESELEVDQKLSESQNFTLNKDLQGYHNFKGTLPVWLFKFQKYQNNQLKEKRLGKIQLNSRKSIQRTFRFRFRGLFSYLTSERPKQR